MVQTSRARDFALLNLLTKQQDEACNKVSAFPWWVHHQLRENHMCLNTCIGTSLQCHTLLTFSVGTLNHDKLVLRRFQGRLSHLSLFPASARQIASHRGGHQVLGGLHRDHLSVYPPTHGRARRQQLHQGPGGFFLRSRNVRRLTRLDFLALLQVTDGLESVFFSQVGVLLYVSLVLSFISLISTR